MADVAAIQVLHDDETRAVVKLLNESDGTGETDVVKVDVSALNGAVGDGSDRVSITQIWADIHTKTSTSGHVDLMWDGGTDAKILLFGASKFHWDLQSSGVKLTNNAVTPTGDITLSTHNYGAGDSYSIIIEVRKETAFGA